MQHNTSLICICFYFLSWFCSSFHHILNKFSYTYTQILYFCFMEHGFGIQLFIARLLDFLYHHVFCIILKSFMNSNRCLCVLILGDFLHNHSICEYGQFYSFLANLYTSFLFSFLLHSSLQLVHC